MNENAINNLSTGHGERKKAGRPPGSTVAVLQAQRVARAQARLMAEQIARDGTRAVLEKFGESVDLRTPLRFDAPIRTVTQAKEAALNLINTMLWTLEQNAAERGTCPDDEARVLKLLAGLNAALPKQAETPNKSPDEMTEEELRKVAGK